MRALALFIYFRFIPLRNDIFFLCALHAVELM